MTRTNTKERVLLTALKLFAKDGYEAVSVSQIAGELGITKGALYKHFKNKRNIFDSIFEHICQLDIERSKKAGIPEIGFDKMNQNTIPLESLIAYMESQFEYWTRDEIACNFRRMLTLEQYRNPEMNALYQKVLGSGPLTYLQEALDKMVNQEILVTGDTRQMAVELYAPFYLLLTIVDATSDDAKKQEIENQYRKHMNHFIEKYKIINKE